MSSIYEAPYDFGTAGDLGSSGFMGPVERERLTEEERRRKYNDALLASRATNLANAVAEPGEKADARAAINTLKEIEGGSKPASWASPEAAPDPYKAAMDTGAPPKISPSLLGASNTKAVDENAPGQRMPFRDALEKQLALVQKTQDIYQSSSLIGRERKRREYEAAREGLATLMAGAREEAVTPAIIEEQKARAGWYGRPSVVKEMQDASGRYSLALVGPHGPSVFDTGVTGPVDIRKQVESRGGIVTYRDPVTGEIVSEDQTPMRAGAGGVVYNRGDETGKPTYVKPYAPPHSATPRTAIGPIINGYNRVYQTEGPAAANAYLAKYGLTAPDLIAAMGQIGTAAAPGAASAAAAVPDLVWDSKTMSFVPNPAKKK